MSSVTSDHTTDCDVRSHRDVTSHETLVSAMTELEFTKSDLALMFGVTRETVSRWAGGKMPIPKWVQFALDGIRFRRMSGIKKAPSPVVDMPKVTNVTPPVVAVPVREVQKAADPPRTAKRIKVAVDCSPAPVPGRWRFGTFYPD